MPHDIIVNIQKLNAAQIAAVRRIADADAPPSLDDAQTLAQAVLVLNQAVNDLIHAMTLALNAKRV